MSYLLRPPCEIIIPSFIRGIRVEIAKKLRNEGEFTQQEISHVLGVSQPVVNQYLSKDYLETEKLSNELREVIQETSNEIVEAIYAGFTEEKVLSTLCLACKRMRTDGALCGVHKDLISAFQAFRPCTACRTIDADDLEELERRRRLILKVESLIEFLSSLPKFADLIPAVGTQICLALPSADVLQDIVALPGGIVSVKGRPILISKHAEFGGSKTTAGILLLKKNLAENVNAVISLRNTEKIRKILDKKGIQLLRTKGGDKNWSMVFTERKNEAEKANVIADDGEVGYEAILYLFASSTAELKSSIEHLVHHL